MANVDGFQQFGLRSGKVKEKPVAFPFPLRSPCTNFAGMSEKTLKEKTAKGLLWGGVSNGAQQLLNLIFGIFLARLLAPSDYGMVGMLTIFSLIASTLQESGFISGLNRKENITPEDYNAVFWFNVLCSLTTYAILFAAAPLIAAWFRQPVLVPLARLSFLSFVISAFNTSARAWLFRNMRVKETAITSIMALAVSGVTGVTLAWNGFAYWGIAIQNLVFCLVLTAGSWWYAEWRPALHIDLRPLKGMIGYSFRLLATNIFTHVNNNIFSIFFGRLYGESVVGYYNQANKWTGMGHTLLTGMVWSVTQPLFARLEKDERERMRRVFRKMLRFTAFLSFPALFGLALVAPEFITIAITAKWLPSARLMEILCIGGAFVPISSFYSNFVISQGKSNWFMWSTISLCLVQMLLLVTLYPWGVNTMVIAYVTANTLWLLVWHSLVRRLTGLRFSHVLLDMLPFAGLAALGMGAAWLAARPLSGHIVASLVVKIAVAAVAYLLLLRVLGAKILKECWGYLFKKGRADAE